MQTETKCPFHHAANGDNSNRDWWPNQLKLELLHQHSTKSNPMAKTSITPRSSRASTSLRSKTISRR